MHLFLALFNKILPLYCLVFLGFVLGRVFDQLRWEVIGVLLLYVMTPVVVFSVISTMRLDLNQLLLPLFFFSLCCLICLAAYYLAGRWFKFKDNNILAFAVGTGNTGYFGLPVVIALLGGESLGLAVLSAFGFILYENTLGFFIAAKGCYTTRESLLRLLRLPALYAFIGGVLINLMGFKLMPVWVELGVHVRGAYIVLGMMLIGLSISQIRNFKIDFRFIGVAFLAKFMVWPLMVCLLIMVDSHWLRFFDKSVYAVMLIMSLVPLPVNSVALAMALSQDSRQISASVLLSTLFALIYMPAVMFILA